MDEQAEYSVLSKAAYDYFHGGDTVTPKRYSPLARVIDGQMCALSTGGRGGRPQATETELKGARWEPLRRLGDLCVQARFVQAILHFQCSNAQFLHPFSVFMFLSCMGHG